MDVISVIPIHKGRITRKIRESIGEDTDPRVGGIKTVKPGTIIGNPVLFEDGRQRVF
jgi:hypothetical protein